MHDLRANPFSKASVLVWGFISGLRGGSRTASDLNFNDRAGGRVSKRNDRPPKGLGRAALVNMSKNIDN